MPMATARQNQMPTSGGAESQKLAMQVRQKPAGTVPTLSEVPPKRERGLPAGTPFLQTR